MKYLIFVISLTGCVSNADCPNDPYRNYKFNEKVIVASGFYEGSTGLIRDRGWIYDGKCAVKSFDVMLNVEGNPVVRISQYELYVK